MCLARGLRNAHPHSMPRFMLAVVGRPMMMPERVRYQSRSSRELMRVVATLADVAERWREPVRERVSIYRRSPNHTVSSPPQPIVRHVAKHVEDGNCVDNGERQTQQLRLKWVSRDHSESRREAHCKARRDGKAVHERRPARSVDFRGCWLDSLLLDLARRQRSIPTNRLAPGWRHIVKHADDLRRGRSTRKGEPLLDDDLLAEGDGKVYAEEGDGEAPGAESKGREKDGRRAIELLGELGKGGDDADESSGEREGTSGDCCGL